MIVPERGSKAYSDPAKPDRLSWAMIAFACVLQIVLGSALAWTHLPLCDEGFYGVPAHMLSVTGKLTNPVMEPAQVNYLRGIDRDFYWMVPRGMVLQAAAFKVFGFGLLVQRGLSVVCGLGALLFWTMALRHLVTDRVAALAAVFLSIDTTFLTLSCLGRSDMISLFFAMAALAGYMHWRRRSLALALAVANTACALSGIVHPNGGLAAVASLAVLVLSLDRTRLRWSHLAVVAACYCVAGLGWGWYIAQAPDLFVAQFLGNAGSRLGGPMYFPRMFKGELMRYLPAVNLGHTRGIDLVISLIRVSYLSAIAYCAFSKDIRRRSAVLVLMFAAIAITLLFLEGLKQGWYLVNLSPEFCALLAICVSHLWKSKRIALRALAAAQVFVLLLGVAGTAYAGSKRNRQYLYQPTMDYLNAHVGPEDAVFGRSELYFGLRCRTCLRDDENLGEFSGRRAQYIVLDPDYAAHLEDLRTKSPEIFRDIEARLHTEYHEVFLNANYQVLRRTATGP